MIVVRERVKVVCGSRWMGAMDGFEAYEIRASYI